MLGFETCWMRMYTLGSDDDDADGGIATPAGVICPAFSVHARDRSSTSYVHKKVVQNNTDHMGY
jgi:hypothetical protein